MADKWYTAASGNWSTAANWNSGTKPVAGDDVYADGKTVTIDEDFTVLSINTTQRSGGTAGGTFQITTLASGTRSLACNVVAGSDNCIRVTGGTAGATIQITGNITGSSVARGMWWTGGSCHLTVTGNLQGGAVSPGHAINFSGGIPGTVTITGTVTAGAGGNGIAVVLGLTLVINGDVYGSTVAGISIGTSATTTTINGVCYSSNSSSDFAGFAIASNSLNETTVSEVVSRGSGVMPISGRNFRFRTTGTRRFTVIDTAGSNLDLEPVSGGGIPIARGMHGGMR